MHGLRVGGSLWILLRNNTPSASILTCSVGEIVGMLRRLSCTRSARIAADRPASHCKVSAIVASMNTGLWVQSRSFAHSRRFLATEGTKKQSQPKASDDDRTKNSDDVASVKQAATPIKEQFVEVPPEAEPKEGVIETVVMQKRRKGGVDSFTYESLHHQLQLPQHLEGAKAWYFAFSSWQRGLFASLGACMGIGLLIYVFWTPIKNDVGAQTAIVATDALNDIKLKEQALVVSKEVVRKLLTDDSSAELVAKLVVKLLADDETRIAVSMFLKSIFEDYYTQEISKKFVLHLVADEWVRGQLLEISKGLVHDLLKNPEVKQSLVNFLVDSTETALADRGLRKNTGKAIRSTVWHTLMPWW